MIRVLSEETINQIAAGEVIERPLSIVKELLENAIDAGASAVSVEIREGGIALIRVTDNGSGMEREEVRTAFLRHATSKIREAADLESIHTLGFRGEALASIASVAKVELITKKQGELLAAHYRIEGGAEKELSEIGAPDGTTMLVRELFFNVPARRKFLKSAPTEAARIQDIIEKEALAHPEVAFRFTQDGKQKLATLGNGSLMDVIYAIYGRDVAVQLLTVKQSYLPAELSGLPQITVRGFVGRPATNRSNRNFEIYFVNGRFVKNPLLTKAIEDGYRAFLMQHKFPFTVLLLDLSPKLVDVNVHPQKLEVRFADGLSVYNSVVDAVQQALRESELVVNTDLEQPREESGAVPKLQPFEPFETKRAEMLRPQYEERLHASLPEAAFPGEDIRCSGSSSELQIRETSFASGDSAPEHFAMRDNAAPAAEASPAEQTAGAASYHYRKTGVLRERAEGGRSFGSASAVRGSGFSLQDFRPEDKGSEKPEGKEGRAVSEEEKPLTGKQETMFQERFLSEKARLQHRIIGQVFETYWLIEYGEKLYIIDQHAAHEKVYFERMMHRLQEKQPVSQYLNPPILLSLSGAEAQLLREYQSYFSGFGYEIRDLGGRDFSISAIPADLPELEKRELLLELLDELSEESAAATAESIYHRIATMSCKAAVKGNHRLSLLEADALISELLTLENPYACPHGRPTIISMSKQELEKKFKRIV